MDNSSEKARMRSIKEDEDYRLASIEDEKRRLYPERYPTITGSGVLLEKLIDKAAVVQPKTAKYKVGPSKKLESSGAALLEGIVHQTYLAPLFSPHNRRHSGGHLRVQDRQMLILL